MWCYQQGYMWQVINSMILPSFAHSLFPLFSSELIMLWNFQHGYSNDRMHQIRTAICGLIFVFRVCENYRDIQNDDSSVWWQLRGSKESYEEAKESMNGGRMLLMIWFLSCHRLQHLLRLGSRSIIVFRTTE